MKTLLGYFWRGCLVIAPVGITFYLGYVTVVTIDQFLPVGVPGLGFLLTLVLVTLIGFATSNVVGNAIVRQMERWLTRVPLVKLLYSSIKDLINAFVGEKKRFDRPVLVSLDASGELCTLGFVTRESLGPLKLSEHVAVYFPQSYNFAGNLVLVPRARVKAVDVNPGDIMAFIVSGGVSGLGLGEHALSRPPPAPRPPPAERTLLGLGPKR
ncbi:MAG: DUF502 domain-containing protein [Polyangiaceae bacterium]